jgi:hypothetical protein
MSVLHDRIQAGRACRHWRRIRLLPQTPLSCTIDSYYGQHLFVMPNSYGKTGIRSIPDIIIQRLGAPNLHCGALNQWFQQTETGLAVPCHVFSEIYATRKESGDSGRLFSGSTRSMRGASKYMALPARETSSDVFMRLVSMSQT